MSTTAAHRFDEGHTAGPVFEEDGGVARLLGSSCDRCGAVAFPRRVVCVRCAGAHRSARLSGAGTLHSWTRLANPPYGFEGELLYGCVELDEGPRVLAPLTHGEPRISAPVQAVPGPVRHGALGFRFEVSHA